MTDNCRKSQVVLSSSIIRGEDGEKQAVFEAAKFMQVAARTAPKAYVIDHIYTLIIQVVRSLRRLRKNLDKTS
ncbi:MAG: hypothetical protein QXH24_03675 [Candidatus Bathyarchaeia archaeon]